MYRLKFTAMNLITCYDLKEKLERGDENLRLINALEPPKFRAMHIPGSLNLCSREEVISAAFNKQDQIVVYCTDSCCNKSITLYYLLESLGFPNISRYAGGLTEWETMGFPLVGDMVEKGS